MNNATLTPRSELYKAARLAEGGEILALHCALMTEADMAAEQAHFERTGRVRGAESKVAVGRGFTTTCQGFVDKEGGVAKTLFGASNLGRQVDKHGSLSALLKARFGYTGQPVVNGSAPVKEMSSSSLEEKLKAIRAAEAEVVAQMALVREKEEAALNELAAKVAKFCKLDLETLKEVLTEAGATDLESGLEAAMAYSA